MDDGVVVDVGGIFGDGLMDFVVDLCWVWMMGIAPISSSIPSPLYLLYILFIVVLDEEMGGEIVVVVVVDNDDGFEDVDVDLDGFGLCTNVAIATFVHLLLFLLFILLFGVFVVGGVGLIGLDEGDEEEDEDDDDADIDGDFDGFDGFNNGDNDPSLSPS